MARSGRKDGCVSSAVPAEQCTVLGPGHEVPWKALWWSFFQSLLISLRVLSQIFLECLIYPCSLSYLALKSCHLHISRSVLQSTYSVCLPKNLSSGVPPRSMSPMCLPQIPLPTCLPKNLSLQVSSKNFSYVSLSGPLLLRLLQDPLFMSEYFSPNLSTRAYHPSFLPLVAAALV